MEWLNKIVRPEIITLVPYSSARSEHAGDGNDEIQLDANENPWTPPGQSVAINRYPEPQSVQLKRSLAKLYGVTPEQLLVSRGADEGIDLLIRTFCCPNKDAIVIAPPTFFSYEVYANIQAAKVISVPLNSTDFSPNIPQMIGIKNAKLIFVCAPNNPTGSTTSLEQIIALCEAYKEQAMVVVDEAYIEFTDTPSALTLLPKYPHLIVLRTLSKAYGLAGARIGAVVAHAEVVALVRKVDAPYPIPTLSSNAALEVLKPENSTNIQEKIALLKKERERLFKALQASADIVRVLPSITNFLLVIAKDADALYQKLQNQKIIVRNWNKVIPGGLRVTIGNPQENERLLATLGV